MLSEKTVIDNLKRLLDHNAMETLSSLTGLDKASINDQLNGNAPLTVAVLINASEILKTSPQRLLSSEVRSKNSDIRLLVLDIDGVLTNGGMYYTESGDEFKKFNTKDGLAIKRLTASGFQVAFLSSGINAKLVSRRAELLGVQNVYTGLEPKIDILTRWKNEMGIEWEQIAFVGDDVNDLAVMKLCGLTACPSDASPRIKEQAHVILQKRGGEGCVRDFIEQTFLEI